MVPKEKQKIEIEKSHRDPLLSFNQAVTVDCSDFLGTALLKYVFPVLAEAVGDSLGHRPKMSPMNSMFGLSADKKVGAVLLPRT